MVVIPSFTSGVASIEAQEVAMKHEDRLNETALQIYPKAREYELTITSTLANGQIGTGNITATEKWVEGRYIVSEAQSAGPETKFAMIVKTERWIPQARPNLKAVYSLAERQPS